MPPLKSKAIFLTIILVLVVAVLLTGCSNPEQVSGEEENIYTIADDIGDWGFPAPYTHYLRGPGYVLMSLVFDTLIWKDEAGFTGLLAEEWDYIQGENAFLFKLRKNVTWHDGKDFTAEDVVFTFNYVEEHPYPWSNTGVVTKVEAFDEHTVKIFLQEPYVPFLANVAGTLPILPQHIYQDISDPKGFTEPEAVTGTGPFKLLDYDREHGTYLFVANKDYYLKEPAVDKIRFVKVSRQMIPAAITDGTANTGQIPSETKEKFSGGKYEVVSLGHNWCAKLIFNHREGLFASKKMRQALAYAIDRNRLVEIGKRGFAVKGSTGLLPPDSPWYSPDVRDYSFSPEKTKALLQELGYTLKEGYFQKDGKILEVELLIKDRFATDAELIREDLEKAGIKAVIKSMENKTVDSKIQNWDFELAISGHGGLGGDPQMLNKFVLGKDFNSVRYYKNEKLVGLLRKQIRTMDEGERKDILAEVQRIYSEELPALTLYYPDRYWAHDGKIRLYDTPGGLAIGIPLPLNKLSFLVGE